MYKHIIFCITILISIPTYPYMGDGMRYNTKEGEDAFSFAFSGKYFTKFKVMNREKNKKVEWECVEGGDWVGTRVIFSLEGEGDNTTILRFAHSGWKEDYDKEILANINYNWGRFLFSLKIYCERGEGFPVKVD